MAVASFVAILASSVVRLLIPDFLSNPDLVPGGASSLAFFFVLFVFLLPLLWWRTTVGYVGAVILGILGVVGETMVAISMAAAGTLSPEIYFVVIPAAIFSLLLIVGSVLAWRER